MIRKTILFLAMASLVGACSSDGGSGGSSVACTKDIQSVWTATAFDAVFDLRDVELNTPGPYTIAFGTGEVCELTGEIRGGACSGQIIISSSTYLGGGSGDPGCSLMVETSDYTITGASMLACDVSDASDCVVYE